VRGQHHVKLCDRNGFRSVIAPHTFLHALGLSLKPAEQDGAAPLIGTQPQNQSRRGSCRTRRTLPLNVATVASNRLGVSGIIAIRLSVPNYNMTLSSDSLDTGTGSSNSLPSAQIPKLFGIEHRRQASLETPSFERAKSRPAAGWSRTSREN
jgi:hypothetical protein